MSRIRGMTLQLQPVQIESAPWEGTSSSDDTTSNGSHEPTPWWSVRESLRMLQCSGRFGTGEFGGSPSLSSPFGSSRVH